MSELIDSIIDVAAIAKEKKQAEEIVNSFAEDILAIKDLINKNLIDIRAAKSVDELSNSAKKLNDSISDGEKAVKAHQTELDKLKQKTEQLTGAEKAANIEIAKARLELQAAQKDVKAAAVAEIEAAAATMSLTDSYDALQKDLKSSMLAYKALSAAERDSARGKELLTKISTTQTALTGIDANMKVYNRNVGNYASAFQGLGGSIGGIAGRFTAATAGLQQFSEKIGGGKSSVDNLGSSINATSGAMPGLTGGVKTFGSVISSVGKSLMANPIIAVLAVALGAIILIFKQFKNAIADSEERQNKLSEATSRFKPVLRAIGDVFEAITDIIIKSVEWFGKAFSAVTEFLGISPKGSANEFVQAEKSKQEAILKTRKLNEDSSNQEAIIAEQRAILAEKENYSYQQRVEALKKAGEAEKQLAKNKQEIAELNLKALREEAALDDNNADMNDKLSAAIVSVNNARRESASVQRTLAREEQRLIKENEADLKAQADAARAEAKERAEAAKEAARNILEAQRRLTDSQLALMAEGEEKQIAINAENFKRKLEDLKANGQLTAELQANLEKVNEKDLQKIREDFAKQKKEKDAQDLDALLANYEKSIKKQTDILSASYKQQESDLKKQYANGKISKEQYDEQLIALQSKAVKEANDITIASLQKQLDESIITDEKRAELSAKLRDLQIDNENAVTDAIIKANESKIESDKAAFDKRVQIAEELANAGLEVFAAIGDYQAQQAEKRIAELDAQQAKNDELYEAQNSNLEKAIMSDARREEAQKKIDTEKAKRDKEIADKKQKEEIRAAKWEKAQALTSAIINTTLASIKALVDPGGVLGLVYAALAATTGAISIATIASQPIPAYAEGGVTGSGLALWGEVRPEVAVTPSGQIMYAENPTVQNFDAGTRIFKSVEEFERNISMSNGQNKGFEFDYEKMGEVMPEVTVNLDPSGLWGIVNKQGDRAIMINRRYKIGN
jgi:hypothetical protein